MNNPLNYITKQDIKKLGLSKEDLQSAYQPSEGGVWHARGAEGKGKTLLIAHLFRDLIDRKIRLPSDAVGNMSFKGKYTIGYQVLKSDDLRQYLWDLTHKPYRNKVVFIDEIDSEFPARFFMDKEQTEIALRLWHTAKLGNYIYMSSHIGNSADLIFHEATHYYLYPDEPNWETNTMDYILADRLHYSIEEWVAYDVIPTMLIYHRRELTEDTEAEQNKIRPSLLKKARNAKEIQLDNLNFDLELEGIK